jgi:hypothetical protein
VEEPHFTISILEEHATAIGFACIVYGCIENAIVRMVAALADLQQEPISDRRKVQMAKSLAYCRKPTDEWFKARG